MTLHRKHILGTGQLGETYLADADPEDQPVAVKELTRVYPLDDAEFSQHIEALSRLDHPNLNKYHYLETDGPIRRIVQSFFDGTDLQSYLRRPPTRREVKSLRRRQEPADDESPAEDTPEAESDGDSDEADDRPTPNPDEQPSSPEAAAPSDNQEGEDSTAATVPSERPTTGPLQAVELDPDDVDEQFPDDIDPRAQLDLLLFRLEQLLPQILAGLDYLHRFGHVHGDLRPSNILINEDGQCRLVDYGLVSQLRPIDSTDATFNPNNTPPDVPGERFLQPADDIYAIGCLLFELITGIHPSKLQGDSAVSPERLPDAASDELDLDDCAPADLSLLQPRCPAEWVDLILRMLDPDPENRPSLDRIQEIIEHTEARSVDVPPSLVPEQQSFFGRPELLEELSGRAAVCADEDRLGLTLLSGAAGTGKSALAARTIHWAAERGWLYLRGSCYPRESLILQGWDQIAARLANVCHRLGPELQDKIAAHRHRASRLFPVLRTTNEPAPDCGRRAAVDAFRKLLRILSSERPILIVFDDLTWASWDTTSLLGDILVDPTDFPCFIVGTWRPGTDSPETRRLEQMLGTAPLDVGWLEMRDLSTRETADFVDSVGEHIPADYQRRIVERGLRNPLLLQELAFQFHLESQTEPSDSGTFVDADSELDELLGPPNDSHADDSSEFPPTDQSFGASHPPGERPGHQTDDEVAGPLRRLLDRRLESLNRRQQFLVEILSVAALPLPEGLLSIILEDEFGEELAGEHSARSILEALRNLRLVRRVDTHPWGDAFTLFHNIARTLVYRDLREQRYTHLCSRVADGLRQFWPEAKELRFEYLLRADRMNESLDLATRSAREAADRFAYNRAAKLWRWICTHGDDSAQASGLRPERELAICEHGAGRHQEAAKLFKEVADTLPDSIEKSRIRFREFRARLEAGDRRETIRALDDGLSAFGDHYGQPSFFRRISELKNRALAASSRWSDRIDSTRTDSLSTEIRLRGQLYFDAVRFNDILDSTRGDRFQAKLSAMAESTGHARLLGFDRILLAASSHLHGRLRRPDRARERYDQADELFSRSDYPMGEAFSRLGRARLDRQCGNFDVASDHLDQVHRRYDRQHDDAELMELATRIEHARLARDAGRLDEALSSARRIRHLFRFSRFAQFQAHLLMTPISLVRGKIQHADDLLESCRDAIQTEPLCWYSVLLGRYLARVRIARGQPEVAFVQLEMLEEQLDSQQLLSLEPVRRTLDLGIGQALMARSSFSPRLGEPDDTTVRRRLKRIIDRLADDVDELSPVIQSEIHRLAARWRLYRDRPQRALESAESALTALRDYPSPLARGPALEARARVLLANDDEKAARSLYRAVQSVYSELSLQSPLVLEGWPVPRELSRLRPDSD